MITFIIYALAAIGLFTLGLAAVIAFKFWRYRKDKQNGVEK